MDWYLAARRDLPWRQTRDPWRILLSEVMLQQTRVSVVIPYYERFLARFPTAASLAVAPESDLLAAWSGLGYYTRARNLQKAAIAVTEAGGFPTTYERILNLPGVGDYTAAAVASIAFGLPYAVLDGNVMRVLSRVLAERGDIQSQTVRVRLKEQAQLLLDTRKPGEFNQALMELGATICLPKNPQCLLCPWRDHCAASALGIQNELPVKLRKRDPIKTTQQLCIVTRNGSVLMRQRDNADSRLAGFWEFPELREVPHAQVGERLGDFRHSITRTDYVIEVYSGSVVRAPKGFSWIHVNELDRLPVSTTARKALQIATAHLRHTPPLDSA